MKKIILTFVLAATFVLSAFCGCVRGVSGIDGRDGQDLSIYEVYEAANAARSEQGLEQIDFLGFLQEYLHYDFTYSEEKSAQEIMNRSLMSCVAVLSGFNYTGWYSRTEYFAGAGVIVEADKSSGDAYILTNCHVVYDDSSADEVYIYLYGNDGLQNTAGRIPADIIGLSVSYDLALLKVTGCDEIKSGEYIAAAFADAEEVYTGAKVYTVGNPEGSGISVTSGIISKESEIIALNLSSVHSNDDRYANEYRVIRTDTAVNGGNSGGGLFGSDGKLVGIVNSKVISSEIENMGYALAGSYVKRAWLLMRDEYNARGEDYNAQDEPVIGLDRAAVPVSYNYTSSAYFDNEKNLAVIVDKVYATSSESSENGIKQGDVFKRVRIENAQGQTVEDLEITRYFNLEDVLLSARDNYKIIYTVLRNGEEITVETSPEFVHID